MSLCECGCGQQTALSKRSRPDRGQAKGEPSRFVRGHAMRGKRLSSEARAKMSAVRKGRTVSAETRAKLSAATPKGPDHPGWKGEQVAYPTIHSWVKRHKTKRGVCSRCAARRLTQWANVSGRYERDLDDFVEMCVPCHSRYDRARRQAA